MKQLTTAAVLGFTLNVSALTQYVSNSGTTVTGTLTELGDNTFAKIKDQNMSTKFHSYQAAVGEGIQLDLGSSKSIETIFMFL